MPTVLEPIGAGITVALVNKFVINNSWVGKLLSGCWLGCPALAHHPEEVAVEEECVSSTSTTTVDSVEVHAHF